MDRTEARCGQSGEHERMRPDGLRNAFAAAGDPGVQELPHVARVLVRTGRTDRGPPVAAPLEQDPVRLAVG